VTDAITVHWNCLGVGDPAKPANAAVNVAAVVARPIRTGQ
jgi:hypothetical protein